MLTNIPFVLEKLKWMQSKKIWPNGLRYLWTDAFGLVLYVSLYNELNDKSYLDKAEQLVDDVELVLGRKKGIRIGEEIDRYGQYYHYLAMWIYALAILGNEKPEYRKKAIQLVKDIHPHFVVPGVGVQWKMKEDLSEPEPGFGFGALDHFHGYIVYSFLEPDELADEINQMKEIIENTYKSLLIDQDLGLGIMLWLTHFKNEEWSNFQRKRCLDHLETLWIDPPGFFCRNSMAKNLKFAFTNYGISLGLQSLDILPDRVEKLNNYFQKNGYKTEYEKNAITHVMECISHFPGEFIQNE